MKAFFEKHRTDRYVSELAKEYEKMLIAEKSFCVIKTPHPVCLRGGVLTMEKMPGADSSKFKHNLSADRLVYEYVKITKMLWGERLSASKDLTPEWVKAPKLIQKKNLHPDFRTKSSQELRSILNRAPSLPSNGLWAVHGDLCPVNIMMDQSGSAYGLVDLGDLHVGDRMLDVAVLSWTIRGNFGKRYEQLYLDGLDISIDSSIIEYYRLIYDLSLPAYKSWDWIKE